MELGINKNLNIAYISRAGNLPMLADPAYFSSLKIEFIEVIQPVYSIESSEHIEMVAKDFIGWAGSRSGDISLQFNFLPFL